MLSWAEATRGCFTSCRLTRGSGTTPTPFAGATDSGPGCSITRLTSASSTEVSPVRIISGAASLPLYSCPTFHSRTCLHHGNIYRRTHGDPGHRDLRAAFQTQGL